MKFSVFTSFDEIAHQAQQWNDLVHLSASDVPFLRFEYLQTWWQTRGGGEWQPEESQLMIIIASEADAWVGIAPFFSARNAQGQVALLPIGCVEVSDYLDVICAPAQLDAFVDQLLSFLASLPQQVWQVLDFYNLLDDSATLAALQKAAQQNGLSYQQTVLQPAPLVQLPGDWEAYLASLDKKQRHEIRRKIRRAEEAGIAQAWYVVQDATQLQDEVAVFINLMAQDAEKQAFLTPIMRQYLQACAQTAFANGWLHLAFLTLGGEKAAGYLSFLYNQRLWVYNSCWDGRFAQYSPGWVLLACLLQWANEHQLEAFDFMRGDESYKYRFGAADRHVLRAVISRPV